MHLISNKFKKKDIPLEWKIGDESIRENFGFFCENIRNLLEVLIFFNLFY